jgi:hypothetical protein
LPTFIVMPIFGIVTLTLNSQSSFQFQISSPHAWINFRMQMHYGKPHATLLIDAID